MGCSKRLRSSANLLGKAKEAATIAPIKTAIQADSPQISETGMVAADVHMAVTENIFSRVPSISIISAPPIFRGISNYRKNPPLPGRRCRLPGAGRCLILIWRGANAAVNRERVRFKCWALNWIGSSRCQKKCSALLTRGRLMSVTVIPQFLQRIGKFVCLAAIGSILSERLALSRQAPWNLLLPTGHKY